MTKKARNKIIFVSISDVRLSLRSLFVEMKSENLWKILLQTFLITKKKYLTLQIDSDDEH